MTLEPATLASSAQSVPSSLLIGGPTASGKSEVALLLAERLSGEIVSVDSMQVYRGLNLGTAKPSLAERLRVPHHLVDALDLNEQFDAAKFVELAQAKIAEIQSRRRLPILCGGTGLYFKALLEGLGEAPPADSALRAELEATPLASLLAELAEQDSESYERIDRQNPRRVIRAIEVLRLTGRPFSQQQARWSSRHAPLSTADGSQPLDQVFFALTRSSADLKRRIDLRVDEMFRAGLVAEVENLLRHGLAENRTASQALGYRQVIEFLHGARSLSQTVELVKIRTRQFAKRQLTWFRRQLAPRWIQLAEGESSTLAAEWIEREFWAKVRGQPFC